MDDDERKDILTQLGFTKNEAAAYLALTHIGESTTGKIAEVAGLHRTNAYDALDRLVKKGFVSYILNGKTKVFETTSPDFLKSLIKEKEIKLEKLLPELQISKQLAEKKLPAQIHEGLMVFQRLLAGLLKHNDEIIAYGVPKAASERMKYFLMRFHKERISKKIPMRHIYNYDAKERIKFLNKFPLTEARFLPQKYESVVTTAICADEILITHWIDKPLTIQIINKQLAEVYKKYFEIIYRDAKNPTLK